MKFWVVVFLFLSSTLGANLDLPVQSSSPSINEGPWGIEIPNQLIPLTMRVLVFPHTLKKDYRHGVPDNPYRLKVFSEVDIKSGGKFIGKEIVFSFEDGGLFMESKGFKKRIPKGVLALKSKMPLRVFRENNPKKTHQYEGTLEIRAGKDRLLAINHLLLEKYLRGVLPNEVVKTWPMDVLKVQAVAARTYAVYHRLLDKGPKFWDVDDTARYQVFTGISHVVEKTDLAVKETSGEIMTYKERVIKAYFHSYSGGKTSSAKEIFDEINEYCLGTDEIFTREELLKELNPKFSWIVQWTTPKIDKLDFLGLLKNDQTLKSKFRNFKNESLFLKAERDNSNFNSLKNLWVIQGERRESLSYKELRRLFGYGKVYSYWFYLNNQSKFFQLKGHGWGHHVGMSQWGAFMMANNYGYEYKDILNHYYKGISLREL